MKVNRKLLLHEIVWINRFVEESTIPILSNVLFSARGKTLTLTATDLDCGGTTTIEGIGKKDWDVTAPVSRLIKYLTHVEEDEIALGSKDHQLLVTHGALTSHTVGISSENYPELPTPPAESFTILNLPLAVGRTAFSIAREESRFTPYGALLEIEDGARLIATDGHRLSLAPLLVKGAPEKLTAMLPKFMLLEAGRLDGECLFSMNDDHVFLQFGTRRIVGRKLTVSFPDWHRVVGDEFPNHVFLPRKDLLKTIDRVAIYADERSKCIRFELSAEKLQLIAESTQEGKAEGNVAVLGGNVKAPATIGYCATYLQEFLRATDQQNIAYCWKDERSAAQFCTDDSWRYAVMPMRLE